jgi:hypothetical protein
MMKFNLLLLSAAALFNGATAAADTVELGTAGNYAILTQTGITTVPSSAITGDIGVYPIAATAMTGFSLTKPETADWAECTQVTGKAYAREYSDARATELNNAVGDMQHAYTDAAGRDADAEDSDGRTCIELNGGAIGGLTLKPGVYNFTTDISITADVTLTGTDTDVFIIKTTGSVVQDAGKKVTLTGGALAKNIFWQVAGRVEVGAGAHMEGILLVKTKAVFKTSSTLNGRVLAQTACTLDHTTVTEPTA